MRAIRTIMEDWFQLIRDQKSFRILFWLALVAGLTLIALEVRPDKVVLLFTWEIPIEGQAEDIVYFVLRSYISVLPFFAYLIALLATGGVVPDLMRRGRIDGILARPVSRGQVVAGCYLGGLLFVFLLSLVLVGSSWLAFAARGRVLSPTYFLNALVILGQYAIIYALAVFFGFALRSTVAAILLTLLFWFLGKIASGIHSFREAALAGTGDSSESVNDILAGPVGIVIEALYALLPKVGELDHFSDLILERVVGESLAEITARHVQEPVPLLEPDWWLILGTSAGLILLLLALATWILRRRDL